MAKTQADAVVEALRANGGYATLGYLYRHTLKVPGVNWGSKTPDATIRRIVQKHPGIFKIRPGLWALEEYRNAIPFLDDAKEDAPEPRKEKFNHSYYQGLLVTIGNLESMQTYVPAQDKNQAFLKNSLGEVAAMSKIYPFSYPEITRFAKTVDVVWFNRRRMPSAFLEVEHSTDIYNSLRKFVELQDFHSRFKIVAPSYRESEFKDKREATAYEAIRTRVEFWSYEDVEKEHEHQSKLAIIRNARR